MDPRTTPIHINAPHGATTTEITWADGRRAVFPNTVLRGLCPCAQCQGHGGTITMQEGGDADLRDIGTVGNYALKLVWGDGHDTGLYSFRYLRELSDRDDVTVFDEEPRG